MTVASAACLGQARATAALRPRRGAGCRAWERTARRVVTADADARVSDATRVVRLDDGPGGATLHLVGVSHVLVDDAARDIRALMRRLRPDAVVLELHRTDQRLSGKDTKGSGIMYCPKGRTLFELIVRETLSTVAQV